MQQQLYHLGTTALDRFNSDLLSEALHLPTSEEDENEQLQKAIAESMVTMAPVPNREDESPNTYRNYNYKNSTTGSTPVLKEGSNLGQQPQLQQPSTLASHTGDVTMSTSGNQEVKILDTNKQN